MKYPQLQFDLLVKALRVLSEYFTNIKDVHPCQLQYLCYQQASEGQLHNAFYKNSDGLVVRGYVCENDANRAKIVDFLNEDNFPLYPAGCNDNHVETAVKKALKTL